VLTGNSAGYHGGAVAGGRLYNCTLTGNTAPSGGAVAEYRAWMMRSALSVLYNCVLTDNSARVGGGAHCGTLYNCTLTSNSAEERGGGVGGSTLYNCIVYFNRAPHGANYDEEEWSTSTFGYSCTTPLPPGPGNIDADPGFVNASGGDFRLRYGSPCIDAGSPQTSTTDDLAGLPRPLDGDGDGLARPDMGAYEFDLRTVVPADWFTANGLDAADPHILSGNPDQDAQTSFQEWLAGTDPRDPLSFFRIEALELGPPVTLFYRSLTGRVYTLYAAPDLGSGVGGSTLWAPLPGQAAVPGTGGLDSLTDTNALGRRFYRVEVDLP
jgi:hypothetical protein